MSEGYPARSAGFQAGSLLAGYRLEAPVGAGGMAVVWRARDVRLNRLVALKMLTPTASNSAYRRRFIAEPRAAAAVDHPHIIPIYEAGEADGVLFIAMRFVHGGDLLLVLEHEGPLPPARTADFISPVASALDAAHGAGLVHRDVKPENILVDTGEDRPDHVYLSDFGIVKGASSVNLTQAGHIMGTLDYSAPEQLEGEEVDGRADQYSLACVTFQLLTGAVPFVRDRDVAVLYAHLYSPPPSLVSLRPDLPGAADEVLAKAMAKNPAERYESCGEFADALRDAFCLAPYHPRGSAPPHPQPPDAAPSESSSLAAAPAGTALASPDPAAAPPDHAPAEADAQVPGGRPADVAQMPATFLVTRPGHPGREADDDDGPAALTNTGIAGEDVPAAEATAEADDQPTALETGAGSSQPARASGAIPAAPDAAVAEPSGQADPGPESDGVPAARDRRNDTARPPAATTVISSLPAAATGTTAPPHPAPGTAAGCGALDGIAPTPGPEALVIRPGRPGRQAGDDAVPLTSTAAADEELLDVTAEAAQAVETAPDAPEASAAMTGPAEATEAVQPDPGSGSDRAPPDWLPEHPTADRSGITTGISSLAAAAAWTTAAPPDPAPAAAVDWVPGDTAADVAAIPAAEALVTRPGHPDRQAGDDVAHQAPIPTESAGDGVPGTDATAATAIADSQPATDLGKPAGAGSPPADEPAATQPHEQREPHPGPDSGAAPATGRPRRDAVHRPGTTTISSRRRRLPALALACATLAAAGVIPFMLFGSSKSPSPARTPTQASSPGPVKSTAQAKSPSQASFSGYHPVSIDLPSQFSRFGPTGSSLAFSPSGATLAIADSGGTCLWDIAIARCAAGFKAANALDFSPDGKILASGDGNGSTYLLNVANGKPITTLTDPGSQGIDSVAFSPDGKTLAVGDGNGSTFLWNLTTSGTAPLTDPHSAGINSVTFSPDGKTLGAGDLNGSTYLWNVSTGKLVTIFPGPFSKGISSVAFSPDGKILAAGGGNGSTYLWNVSTGKLVTIFQDPYSQGVSSVAFSPAGTIVATADRDGRVFLWI